MIINVIIISHIFFIRCVWLSQETAIRTVYVMKPFLPYIVFQRNFTYVEICNISQQQLCPTAHMNIKS